RPVPARARPRRPERRPPLPPPRAGGDLRRLPVRRRTRDGAPRRALVGRRPCGGDAVSSRTCPDWPMLMEIAPELQFKHYTVAEAKLPTEALMQVPDVSLSDVAICCDLDRHVFYAAHTDPAVAEALRTTHWYELAEWSTSGQGGR